MFFGKKQSIYKDNPDVSKICATCKFGKPLSSSDEVLCEKHGLVDSKHTCKKYDYNRLMKRPPKKREIRKSYFEENDFSID